MKLALLFLFICSNTFAQEKFICSLLRAKKTVEFVNSQVSLDKAKHCSVSCILNLDCSKTEVYLFGLGKELADLLGAGEPDVDDIKANRIGINASEVQIANDSQECVDYCVNFDWRVL